MALPLPWPLLHDVYTKCIHYMSSPMKSVLMSNVKSILLGLDFSQTANAENIACVDENAGRTATIMLMHSPPMCCSVRKEIHSASKAAPKS